MNARFLLVVIAVFGAVGLRAAADSREVPVVLADVVALPRLEFLRGSDARGVDRALGLCRTHADGTAAIACTTDLVAIEHPQRPIVVSAFSIDRTEVTQRAYLRCVATGGCRAPRGLPDTPGFVGDELPVVGVSHGDARRYCAVVGGRLPTEAEWERAARGSDARIFPWGDEWDPRCANHGRALARVSGADGYRYLAPVGSFATCAIPSGLVDLAGNVAEWVEDPFVPDGYERSPAIDPRASGGSGLRIVRGGSFLGMPHQLRVAARRIEAEDTVSVDVGFRCAYEPGSP